MLLRRINQHIKEQNWFAVVLDFLIVVVGIFAGLQVDNWNEERKARLEERDYLVRLSEDAAGSIEQGQWRRGFIIQSADRAGVVLRALDECSLDPESRLDFANGLYHLGKLIPPYMVKGTIDELISTGKLGILESIQIRDQMNATLRLFDTHLMVYGDAETRARDHVYYIDSQVVYRIGEPQLGDAEISWEDLDIDLNTVCQDRRFYTAVAAVRNYAYDMAARHEQMISAIRQFKSVVDTELEN